jgi:hypothetical protein
VPGKNETLLLILQSAVSRTSVPFRKPFLLATGMFLPAADRLGRGMNRGSSSFVFNITTLASGQHLQRRAAPSS